MTRQEEIDEQIAACTECGRAGFSREPDCVGCTVAVDERRDALITAQAAEIERLRKELEKTVPAALAVERANTAALVRAAREMLNELPRERVEFGGIRTNETITRVHAALVPFAGIDP